MSPRRRLVAVGAAVLAVLLVVAVALLVRSGDPDPVVAVPQDRPGPVLLVPGYGGGRAALDQLAARLRATGRQADVVPLPGDGTGPLADQARALGDAARAAVDAGAPSVDVVGYSAGGVVARLWVAEQGGGALARRVVTLGSPQHGTEVAAWPRSLAPGVVPGRLPRAGAGQRPAGGLNRGDETPAGPAVGQHLDHRRPGGRPRRTSARLAGALDIPVQDVCPGRQVTHGQLPTDPAVQALVADALGAPAAAPRRPPARSGGDVAGAEAGPGQAEQHHGVPALHLDPAHHVVPEDRVAEDVDPGQPPPGRQVVAHRARRRPG